MVNSNTNKAGGYKNEETQAEIEARNAMTTDYLQREQNLTDEQIVFLETKFSSKLFRMNNLYTIMDKEGVKRIMHLNDAQRKILTQFKHNKKIILKSRQQGISTLYLAYYLDNCITKPGYQAGIQSYGQDEAEKLSKRALLMWDDLDPEIKELLGIKLVANNSKGMTFSNGSILKIGNFRGDTLQGLHVSELGKIGKRYPEKAKELKTGAFQAVSKYSKITIESTAEGNSGLFFDTWFTAVALADMGAELTPLDFQAIFLSWLDDPDCHMEQTPSVPHHKQYLVPELELYFEKLELELNIVIEQAQKNWYIVKKIELGNDMKQEYPATPQEAFEQSIEGTYYRIQYEALMMMNRIGEFKIHPNLPIDIAFDLGINDDFVILFGQQQRDKYVMFADYSNTGQGLDFYVKIVDALCIKYNVNIRHAFAPHDISVKELGTGRTRLEVLRELGINPIVLPKLSIIDGITAVREFLKNIYIDTACKDLITSIQNYRKTYDEKLDVYLDKPVHDAFSHLADGLRYFAIGMTKYRLEYSKDSGFISSSKHGQVNNVHSGMAM
jgi:hypothetical protein